MGLELTASLTPAILAAEGPAAVTLELVLANRGTDVETVYVDFGASPLGGWAGPFLTMAVQAPDGRTLTPLSLRTSYHPPAPAPASFVTDRARKLRRGTAHATTVPCAWFPRGSLPARSLEIDTLDPEKMDGLHRPANLPADAPLPEWVSALPRDLTHCAILVIAASLEEVERRRAQRVDFLRPGFFLAFDDPGVHRLSVAYSVDSFMAFRPKRAEHLEAQPIELRIP